ncbi:MAG: YcaO-like family protein [Acidobacteriota bacterium]|nr:YcaO-like family protein [Acidobacteriota bacterium]
MQPESVVSPYVGVVRGIEDGLAAPDGARLAAAWCESAHPRVVVGSGSGETAREARAAALGEALERYSASLPDPDRLIVASARELGARAVDPLRFALFSKRQYGSAGFPYTRFDRETRLAWVEGVALPGGEPAFVPAQLVHLAGFDDETPLCRTTSSGLACHTTVESATLGALLEVLERDAFMLTWKTRLSWPLLEWSGNAELEAFERASLRPTGLHWRAVDLSAIWEVPIVAAVVRGGETLGVGAAAAATVRRAATKALDEATRVRTWAQALRRSGAAAPAADAVEELDDHVRFYSDPVNAPRVDFLDCCRATRRIEHVPDVSAPLLPSICERLARRGFTAYAVEVTSPDVREAGMHVVRAIAPELCALDVEHRARLHGGRRLYEEPRRLGRADRVLAEDDLNPDPHPFP